jgi:DNA (cytosine-5)-methyltransferase 1
MDVTAVDLFCGCGGLSQGLAEAGFTVAAGIDVWKDAITVYASNHGGDGHDAILHDLSDEDSTIELVSSYLPFLIAGGPPCQDFSSAGHRKEGDRADLTVKYANVVSRIRPKTFIMENVPRAQLSAAFATARDIFRGAGYGLTQIVLNAAHCGVPQLRKRLFLIGMLDEPDDFLMPSLTAAQSAQPMTVREYVGDEITVEAYYRHPRTYQRRAIFTLDEPSATIRGINRPIPGTYRLHQNDATRDLAGVRALSFDERARIQTFPKGYFDGVATRAAKEQMIGNAVPVNLARYVGERLLAYIAVREHKVDADGVSSETAVEMKSHVNTLLSIMEKTGNLKAGDVPGHAHEIFESLVSLDNPVGQVISIGSRRHLQLPPEDHFMEAAE